MGWVPDVHSLFSVRLLRSTSSVLIVQVRVVQRCEPEIQTIVLKYLLFWLLDTGFSPDCNQLLTNIYIYFSNLHYVTVYFSAAIWSVGLQQNARQQTCMTEIVLFYRFL